MGDPVLERVVVDGRNVPARHLEVCVTNNGKKRGEKERTKAGKRKKNHIGRKQREYNRSFYDNYISPYCMGDPAHDIDR